MYLMKNAIERQVDGLGRLVGLDDIDMSEHEDLKLSPLHYAAWYNMDSAVQQLIGYGADVTEQDRDGATPLHYAARFKQRLFNENSKSQLHLDNYHSSDEDDSHKQTSVCATIKHLLDAGAVVNARDNYGTTPLFYAVLRGNLLPVKTLLDHPDIDIESVDNRKLTVLHIAAKYNRVQIAELLLDRGIQIMPQDEGGLTPMHIAAMDGFHDMVSLLIRRANGREAEIVNALTKRKESALDLAIESKQRTVFEELIKYSNLRRTCRQVHYSPLHIAAMSGTPEMVRMILDKDPLVLNMRSADHSTALHKAAQCDRPYITRILLERKAGIEKTDTEKRTPLLVAAASGSNKVIPVLLEKGANAQALCSREQNIIHIIAKNNNPHTLVIILNHLKSKYSEKFVRDMVNADDRIGNSPLHIAAQEGFEEITKILLENGAKLDKNEDEETPLHVAACHGHLGVVKEIIRIDQEHMQNNESVVIQDEEEDGNTALHLAALRGHTKVCEVLMQAGAELDNVNRNLWPPFFSAVIGGSVDTVKALIKNSDLNWYDRNKETCLHWAAKLGHVKVSELLLKNRVSISGLNGSGQSPLDLAISFGHKDVVMLFIDSEQWKDALRNRTRCHDTYNNTQTTPFRRLIQKMPDAAEKVLDRCIKYPPGVEITDADLSLEFDFEFIDDTYTSAHWGDPYLLDQYNSSDKTYDKNGRLLASAIPYTTSNIERQSNHPLTHMVAAERADLLYHPLSLALIRQKWRLANFVFLSFLIFYGSFTALFTAFMISSTPPYMLNSSLLEAENSVACRSVLREGAKNRWYLVSPQNGHGIVYLLAVLAALGIIAEVFQLYNARMKYIREATNFLDWFTYTAAIAVVAPVTDCGVRTHWQWQLGTACFFIMWINSIMFLRRMPTVGLYIVMVGEVFLTFIKFFVFCFSLFLLAYGFTFFLLMQNSEQFSTPGYSFVKTTVMMIGELDYGDMFHGEAGEESTPLVTYEIMSFALFLTFLCMVTIVIMNLLTGLAVGDVQAVQQQALLKKLALQVELALDVESSMPEKLRRRWSCVVPVYAIRPNKKSSNLLYHFGLTFSGPMSAKSIASAVYTEYEEDLEEERLRKRAEENSGYRARDGGSRLATVVQNQERELGQLRQQLDKLEDMMKHCLVLLEQPSSPPASHPASQPSHPQQQPAESPSLPRHPPPSQTLSLPDFRHIPYIDA